MAAPLQLTTPQSDEDGDSEDGDSEDGDSEDEDRLTLGTSEAAAPVQLTTPQSDKASHATR